jgi:hypothetical protein
MTMIAMVYFQILLMSGVPKNVISVIDMQCSYVLEISYCILIPQGYPIALRPESYYFPLINVYEPVDNMPIVTKA